MFIVPCLESLSLRLVADLVWDVLKTKSTPLEQTLGISLTNLETTLNQLNEYLSLPTHMKLELSRVLSRQYDSCNLFQLALMIELGFHCLDFQHYLQLNGDLTFINVLKFGKKSIKKLILSKWENHRFTSIQTQEFLITSFPYLQELSAHGTCCNDNTLRLVAKYCQHLKKLDVRGAQDITDEGIKFLCSPQSAAKQLVYLDLYETKVTAKGAEEVLKHLACLESLDYHEVATMDLLKSLLEQELVFVRYKELRLQFTYETEKRYKCNDLIRKLPLIFPNLRHIFIETFYAYIEPECVLSLRSLSKIENLVLSLGMDSSVGLFPCDSYRNNLYVQMKNLTDLSLHYVEDVCVHSVLDSTPSLRYLTIHGVIDSGCSHQQAASTYPSVTHLALLEKIGEAVVEKCLDLCPSIKTLALFPFHETPCTISIQTLTNLTHLSLEKLTMGTAANLVKHCKNLQVLNLTEQLPVSEEAMWFQRHSPFVKVIHYRIKCTANWFEDEWVSP